MSGDGVLWTVLSALWLMILGEFVLIVALARQIGQLHRRLAPVGARTLNAGPELGVTIEPLHLPTVGGQDRIALHGDGHLTMAVFVSPTCGICDQIVPALQGLNRRGRELRVLAVASSDNVAQNDAFARRTSLRVPFVEGAELTERWHVAPVPYAVLLDADGRVAAKGMVNNLEQLESLLRAAALSVRAHQHSPLDSPLAEGA